MFSDRLWLLKAAAALGLFSLLCTVAHRDLERRSPSSDRIPLKYREWHGRVFHLTAKDVVAADAESFQIATRVGPLRILTPTPPPVDSVVTFHARVLGPRTLEVIDLVVHRGYGWKRPLNYVVSILTVIGFLWLVRRRFTWRPEQGFFRSRY
jgi:hypothetical protein